MVNYLYAHRKVIFNAESTASHRKASYGMMGYRRVQSPWKGMR